MRRVIVAAVAMYAIAVTSTQQNAFRHPRGYVSYRAATAIAIDGKLDDAPWQGAPWSEAFVDIEGDVKPRPAHLTRVKMLWDQACFYIGAELVEPHLWGTLTEHDSVIFRDNDFEVFIDPNGDNHEYYELEINALNTTWDLLLPKPYKDDGKAVDGWEIAGMKTAVHLDGTLNDPRDVDRGWTVEIALPWKALGELARRPSPPNDGDQWRVNFSRVQWRLNAVADRYEKVKDAKEANWVWSPQGVIDMHRPERWGYVQFSSGLPGTVKFQPDSSWAVREQLHVVYYAQRDFKKAHGRWARTMEELNVRLPDGASFVTGSAPTLVVAGDRYQVTVTQAGIRWHIRQDSLIWKD
jgi:hypothetical protein